MVISHKYRYVFVELPLTGSSAISNELCTNYDGRKILSKHSNYKEFLKQASNEEKNYFVFSCIRNPLDRSVSHYFKYKSDHKSKFSKLKEYKGLNILKYYFKRRYNYIKNSDASFSEYFKKFHKLPYDDWSLLSHKKFNFVLRFENLQNDFSELLSKLKIEQVRPLPIVNKTALKDKSYIDYYSDDLIPVAKNIFWPFMKKWNYEFPERWGKVQENYLINVELFFLNILRKFYWIKIRPFLKTIGKS